MRVCWVFVILLSCCVTPSQNTCSCDCTCPLGASTDIIDVPCPNVTAAEMTFRLLKDQQVIHTMKCNHEKNTTLTCEMLPREHVDWHEDNQQLVVFRLTASSNNPSGIYECEGTVMFPPPMIKVPSVMKIQVLEGHHCKWSGDEPISRLVWIWIVVIALLTLYSLTVTIIAVINWVKLRNVNSHSDYINTKPRATWERKKKRGVQKPIPRHF